LYIYLYSLKKQKMKTKLFNHIFETCITDYHKNDNVDFICNNLYQNNSLEFLLYKKCWIDTVQWHLEDIIRNPQISPEEALKIKRRIDLSNQDRTDLVEEIDDFLFQTLSKSTIKPNARINTETPAWAIDRLSILNLKIFHMNQELQRKDAKPEHLEKCKIKLNILNQQFIDLSTSIDSLLNDISTGNCVAKTYKQMKMYNDPELNPVLRK